MIKISHSGKNTFEECPKKFDLHYNERIRAVYEASPLFFGNAVDEALNVLLLRKKKDLTEEEKILADSDVKEVFAQYMKYKVIAGEKVDLSTDIRANFYKSDYHEAYMEDSDWDELKKFMVKHEYEAESPEKLRNALLSAVNDEGYQSIDLMDRSFLNYATWLSLSRKGLAMLEAYERELLPKIVEVLSIQRKVEIMGDGVMIRGLVDFEAILDDGLKYTVDNKTSGKKYAADSVETSPQLATYNYETQHGNAAYFIMLKKPKKITKKTCGNCQTVTSGREKTCKVGGKNRCGGEFTVDISYVMETQEVRGKISNELEETTLQSYENVIESVETGEFPENREGDCFSFGRKCQYYGYCRSGSMDGLKKLE